MKKNLLFGIMAVATLAFQSCGNESELNVNNAGSENKGTVVNSIPYTGVEELNAFNNDADILNYATARKLALYELVATNDYQTQNWEGCVLSETPVAIYGFDSKPKFYDFIVLDAEGNAKGTVTAYARKSSGSMLHAVTPEIKDYNTALAKSSSATALFADWKGTSYAAVLGKAGDAPSEVVMTEGEDAGKIASDVKEVSNEEIAAEMEKQIPQLLGEDATAEAIAESVESLNGALARENSETKTYWEVMTPMITEIAAMSDDEIVATSGKGFLSKPEATYYLIKNFEVKSNRTTYDNKDARYTGLTTSGSIWCGPWAVGYTLWIASNKKVNAYKYMESKASSVGALGVLNYTLRIFGRPLTPSEMAIYTPLACKKSNNGTAEVSPAVKVGAVLHFDNTKAYSNIKGGRPAMRLCSSGGGLHWMVAVGSYEGGTRINKKETFMMQDNASRGLNQTLRSNYKSIEWWNPWMTVSSGSFGGVKKI